MGRAVEISPHPGTTTRARFSPRRPGAAGASTAPALRVARWVTHYPPTSPMPLAQSRC